MADKKIRVIIDTDAACEADDPFAIVQGLLSPKLTVKGIVAEHFVSEGSMERSLAERNIDAKQGSRRVIPFCNESLIMTVQKASHNQTCG